PATALDTLAGERPVEVSVGGHVAEPPAGRLLLLDDGTGIAYVVLPDTIAAAPPVPVGTRFLAQGLLRRIDGLPVDEAEAWYYDSTAVPVRSPSRCDRSAGTAWAGACGDVPFAWAPALHPRPPPFLPSHAGVGRSEPPQRAHQRGHLRPPPRARPPQREGHPRLPDPQPVPLAAPPERPRLRGHRGAARAVPVPPVRHDPQDRLRPAEAEVEPAPGPSARRRPPSLSWIG